MQSIATREKGSPRQGDMVRCWRQAQEAGGTHTSDFTRLVETYRRLRWYLPWRLAADRAGLLRSFSDLYQGGGQKGLSAYRVTGPMDGVDQRLWGDDVRRQRRSSGGGRQKSGRAGDAGGHRVHSGGWVGRTPGLKASYRDWRPTGRSTSAGRTTRWAEGGRRRARSVARFQDTPSPADGAGGRSAAKGRHAATDLDPGPDDWTDWRMLWSEGPARHAEGG